MHQSRISREGVSLHKCSYPNRTLSMAALLLLSILTAVGCASVRRGAAVVLLPVDQEIELGRKLSAEMEQDLVLHSNQEVQRYVAGLGSRVVSAASRDKHKSMTFTFKVVDDPETINAFALPGGWIYVYTGLLLAAETEAEVIGVLAHEVAHVTRRHIAERLATAYGVQVLAAVALGEDPSTLSKMAANVAGTGYLLRFSREQEVDADVTGVGYTIRAGWSPGGFIDFFARLGDGRQPGSRRALSWISTHPMPEDRITHVKAAIEEHRSVPVRDGRAEHQRLLALLGKSGSTTPSTSSSTSTATSPTQSSSTTSTTSEQRAPSGARAPTSPRSR